MKWLLLCGWLALFIGGVTHYSGSWLTYTMFSIVFLTMLISGFYRQVSYGYLFLVAMLWLGFWFKVTVHLLVDYPFGEPIGFFDGNPAAWDKVLLVATVGSIGVMVARLLYGLAGQRSSMLAQNSAFKAPTWYSAVRRWIWAGLVFVCVGLAIANTSLGILQIGLVPSTVLLWPLNAVISWLIGSGLTFGVATLLWWDVALGRNISLVIYFVLLEAVTSTVSILSRGAFIFHSAPQFFALYKNKNMVVGWGRKNIIAVCMVFVVLFALSNPLVNALRNHYYYSGPLRQDNNVSSLRGLALPMQRNGAAPVFSDIPLSSENAGEGINSLAKFAVDRWIGVEGVMASSSYPKNGGDLFVRALTEHREIGKSTIYQEVCQSHYRFVNMQKFQFASLPGAVGFLYFTGHLWVVTLGMIVLALVVLGSEGLVFRFTSNPLLAALWGVTAAGTVAQMGVDTRGLLIFYFETSCGIVAICFVQSEYFSRMLLKLSALKRPKPV